MQDLADTIRQRIAAQLDAKGKTPITIANEPGISRDTIRNIFRGRSSIPKADTLLAIAKALGTTVAYLIGDTDNPASFSPVVFEGPQLFDHSHFKVAMMLGALKLGVWNEGVLVDLRNKEAGKFRGLVTVPAAPTGFEEANSTAYQILDQSFDAYYAAGEYLLGVDPKICGMRIGDHVILHRMKGDLVELTVREYGLDGGVDVFRTLSREPSLCRTVNRSEAEGSGEAVTVLAVVLSVYRNVVRPTGIASYPDVKGWDALITKG